MEIKETLVPDFSIEISEDEGKRPIEEQARECTLTLFQEGPGNKVDNHYYTRSAVESASKKALNRRLMFLQHKDTRQRPFDDWAASILESWVEPHPEKTPMVRARARVKIHDLGLWRRARDCPSMISVSISGNGSGQPGKGPDGATYKRIIERVSNVKSFDYVHRAGNADPGAEDLREDEDGNIDGHETREEILPVEDIKTLTEHELRKDRPDLVAVILSEFKEEVESTKRNQEQLDKLKEAEAAKDAKVTEMEAKVKESADKLVAAEKKADELQAKDALREHKSVVDGLLTESKLPEKVITERFKERLYGTCEDADSVKAEIEDMKAIIGEAAKEDPVKDAKAAKVDEGDKGKKDVDELQAIREEFGEEPEEDKKG